MNSNLNRMNRTPEEKAIVVHRSVRDGERPCTCGHLRREHLGGDEDCDKCECEQFEPAGPRS